MGLNQLTPDEIYSLKERLMLDDTLTKRYLVKKVGYNPDDAAQYKKAMEIYEDFGILKEDLKTYTYFCLMSNSLLPEELQACYNDNNPSHIWSSGLFLKN